MIVDYGINYSNPVARHRLNDGLVAWWLPLPWYSSGPRLMDIAGRYHGVLTDGPTWGAGYGGFAGLSLDGSNDYVTVNWPTPPVLPITFVWEINRSGSDIAGLFDSAYESVDVLRIRPASSEWEWWNLSPTQASGSVQNTDEQLVGVYEDTGTARKITAYRNGVLVGSTTGGASTTFAWRTEFNIGVMNRPNSFADREFFQGRIYGGRIYSGRALTAGDVGLLHEQWKRGFPDVLNRVSGRVVSVAAAGGGSTATVWLLTA